MERQEYNRSILSILEKAVEEYPNLRFGQILVNLGIINVVPTYYGSVCEDPFYEEPERMIERMINNKNVELLLNNQYIESILYEVN